MLAIGYLTELREGYSQCGVDTENADEKLHQSRGIGHGFQCSLSLDRGATIGLRDTCASICALLRDSRFIGRRMHLGGGGGPLKWCCLLLTAHFEEIEVK